MKSPEGIVWCWKENVDNVLFIFRDNNQEIEINLKYVTSTYWFDKNDKLLLPIEKEFLKSIITKIV